ncbi:protein-glucosylgalactosylhydroxylysine glucosidase isoform X1 [Paramormyrops kingsleyae]|uniref:protein-glucosylgalactosylhydroxylysine glucosidase isoform X1 n=1 Tax=Paramormyrops kingsleyae TaxID=1676925 RepID=UPI003B975BC4
MSRKDPDPYIFTSDSLPLDERFLPPLANGLLGWRVFNGIMHMGGVYNGQLGQCHRADIPCPLAATLHLKEPSEHTFTLDTRKGVFTHSVRTAHVSATQSLYAHRYHPHMLVMEVLMERLDTTQEPLTLELDNSFTPHSNDITFQAEPDYKGGRCIKGNTLTPEVSGGALFSVHLIWTPVPGTLTLLSSQTQSRWVFFTVVADSTGSAKAFFDTGLQLIAEGDLFPSHCRAWAELWAGCGVEISGPAAMSRALVGCLFYLLSAFPFLRDAPPEFGGVSPGGLSNGREGQDYWGHVFWDEDTWMYPNIALFYPPLAKAVLEYRVRTLEGAKENAKQQGYKGLKFPWESAVTGREVCPEDIYGEQEIHINGDVILAFQMYLHLTQDLAMFQEGQGSEVVWGIADYWVSRVTWSAEENCYYINGVMPPDEYYRNVDNSVYTNTVAKLSLQFAVDLAGQIGYPAPPEWKCIADTLKIPFDSEAKYHPEFDGYKKGNPVKQADVVLLGYPLGLPMTPEVRRNDLDVYEPVTDPNGPAMTWSMFAVGWLELGEAKKAQEQLSKCFSNIQEPFQVWSECADGSGAVNFLTGMGGFLQTVLFGYTGFRVREKSLYFSPLLPDGITELRVRGVSYLGNKMDWEIKSQEVCVTVREGNKTSGKAECCPLEVVLKTSGRKIPLKPGQAVIIPCQPGEIQKQQ